VTAANTPEYANLDNIPGSGKQGLLKPHGVRVWRCTPQKSRRTRLMVAFDWGTGCGLVQICMKDKDGVPVCLAMARYKAKADEKLKALRE